MNARVTEPKASEATVVNIPRSEKGQPPKAEAPSGQASPPPAAAAEPKPGRKGGARRLVLMVAVPLVLVVCGGYFWLTGGRYEGTDNAYVQQAKVSLSADIAGRITAVNVAENQHVTAGTVLFTIDPEPYRIALDQANAALASARVNVAQLKVAYGTAQAQLKAAEATLAIRQQAFDRKNALVQQGVNSDATLDDVKLALEQAQSAVDAANQQVAAAIAALGGDPAIETDRHPAVLAAQAQVEQAERNLSKTTVVAPADGIIANVSSLNVGQFVAAGTTIASLVETDGTWVEANFKETQLADMKPGMPAEVEIDAYPGKLEGTVESIGAATGSEFSLIPAQNATGNWVKVVQRIPVRIKLPASPEGQLLKTGMSANVTVDTGRSTLDKLLNR
ncbi:MAG TPA: HlyD family secretion protein [Hypericibacter adhaerens]|uniref:HlyD family secretion protein n=1 Tax=Hypericibacter adhaerens TaxID=2602016 RepID=UPI002C6AB4A3|nr:HlyD family secretion protein [Hypericibacter adhaerens]HWA43937.1 HlyD family secretion protein [Hypericibacter adhaerens]